MQLKRRIDGGVGEGTSTTRKLKGAHGLINHCYFGTDKKRVSLPPSLFFVTNLASRVSRE